MAKAIDLILEKEFQCEADTDEIKTTWLLRSLTGSEWLKCTANGFVDIDLILEYGICGWRDFPDANGNEVPYSRINIGRIDPVYLQEIYIELQRMASMGEEERKNS